MKETKNKHSKNMAMATATATATASKRVSNSMNLPQKRNKL